MPARRYGGRSGRSRSRSRSVARGRRSSVGYLASAPSRKRRASAAPVAVNYPQVGRGRLPPIRIVHSEVCNVPATAIGISDPVPFYPMATWEVSALQAKAGIDGQPWPWASRLASLYTEYKLHRVTMHFIPCTPTSEPGQIVMAFMPNPNIDFGQFTYANMMAQPGAVSGSVWAPLSMALPLSTSYMPNGWKAVTNQANSMGPPGNVINGEYLGGQMMYAYGQCRVAANNITTLDPDVEKIYGNFRFDYDIEFRSPVLLPADLEPIAALAENGDTQHILSTLSPTALEPWGVRADRVLAAYSRGPNFGTVVPQALTTPTATRIYFPPGTYRYWIHVRGTTISALSLTESGLNVVLSEDTATIIAAANEGWLEGNMTVTDPDSSNQDPFSGQSILVVTAATYATNGMEAYFSRIGGSVFP